MHLGWKTSERCLTLRQKILNLRNFLLLQTLLLPNALSCSWTKKIASTKRNTFCFIFPIMEFFGQFVFIINFFFGWPQISCRTYIHKWYEKDHLEAFFLSRKFHCWMPKKVKWMWEEEIENEAKSVFVNSFLSSSDSYIIVTWKLDEIANFSWNWSASLHNNNS